MHWSREAEKKKKMEKGEEEGQQSTEGVPSGNG